MADVKTVDKVPAARLKPFLEEYLKLGEALEELKWIDTAQQPKLPHVVFTIDIHFNGGTIEGPIDAHGGATRAYRGSTNKTFMATVSAPAILAAVRERQEQIRAYVLHKFGVELA